MSCMELDVFHSRNSRKISRVRFKTDCNPDLYNMCLLRYLERFILLGMLMYLPQLFMKISYFLATVTMYLLIFGSAFDIFGVFLWKEGGW